MNCERCGRVMEEIVSRVGIMWCCFECPDAWKAAWAGAWPLVVHARLGVLEARERMQNDE